MRYYRDTDQSLRHLLVFQSMVAVHDFGAGYPVGTDVMVAFDVLGDLGRTHPVMGKGSSAGLPLSSVWFC
jgi:hypothetical protein